MINNINSYNVLNQSKSVSSEPQPEFQFYKFSVDILTHPYPLSASKAQKVLNTLID